MTLPEFRAWLEGYENAFPTQLDIVTERMIPVPTPEQWADVKRRLEGVSHNDFQRLAENAAVRQQVINTNQAVQGVNYDPPLPALPGQQVVTVRDAYESAQMKLGKDVYPDGLGPAIPIDPQNRQARYWDVNTDAFGNIIPRPPTAARAS